MLVLALLVASSCSPPQPDLRVEGVHDLYALFGTAAVQSGIVSEDPPVLLYRLVYLDNKVDDRDGIASIHAPARTAVTWRQLATHGPARLSFGCGVVPMETRAAVTSGKPLPASLRVPVRFQVEGFDSAAGETSFRPLFDETLAPTDLATLDEVRRFELQLPERAHASWTLRFSTIRVEPPAASSGGALASVNWPGWFEPMLRSDGRPLAADEAPVVVRTVHEDLVASLDTAEVLQENPDDVVRSRAFDAALEVPVFGGRRTLVSASAPSRVRWQLSIPPDSALDFAVGMDSEQGWNLPGDGMSFAVEIDGKRAWAQSLNPHSVTNDRGWHLASIDLTPWAGRTVDLELVTETGDDLLHDVGGWANLRILGNKSTRRLAKGEAPNVLVLLMDTLRADRFGCYGNPNALTPRMDAVAAMGVRFADTRTVASYTWPSTASLFTGLYPHAHGVLGNGQAYLVDRVETLAELFSEAGYTTGAFVANPLISRAGNFQQGFETFVNAPSVRARALNDRVSHWLEGREDTALFTYVHYFDPHNPYNAPAGHVPGEDTVPGYSQTDSASLPHLEHTYPDVIWDKKQQRDFQLQNNGNLKDYDGEVLYQDAAIGELLDEWKARGLLDNTIVVLMSDHGEEFFDHGRPFHGPNLYDESLHIPLILTGYGEAALEPAVVSQAVHITDILPTLCELSDIAPPRSPVDGRPLLPDGRAPTRRLHDEPLYFLSMNGEAVGVDGMTEKLAVLSPPWKLIHTPVTQAIELYRLDVDPGELNDLSQTEPAQAQRLMKSLEAWLTSAIQGGANDTGVSPEQAWFLQQLGYVDGTSGDGH